MPHNCTNCGETFDDGSKEMLSGCPECGGHKFQFRPSKGGSRSGAADASDPAAGTGDQSGGTPDADRADSRAWTDDRTTRRWVNQRRESSADPAAPDRRGADADDREETGREGDGLDRDHEDRAQADARRGVVSSDELSKAADEATADPPEEPETPPEDRPDLSELREELNSQFESIRILSPGQYELNLMELYDREEYIISLREDGRYVIEVPETWRSGE